MSSTDRFSTQESGQRYEQTALAFLEEQGLKHSTSNFQTKLGEIDLIMLDGEVLVFVEVRFRKNNHFGGAAQSVTPAKQRKLRRCADYFLQTRLHNSQQTSLQTVPINKQLLNSQGLPPCRFDVIAISELHLGQTDINWIKSAF